MKKAIVILIANIMIITTLTSFFAIDAEASGSPIYVDDDADPSWYNATHVKTIQEGIGNASSGDTVFVYNGIYYENIVIDKSIYLWGQDRENTTIKSQDPNLPVIEATANSVDIVGFTVEGAGVVAGIYLNNINCCSISNVFVTNNYEWGIHLYSSTNVGIFNSVIKSNLGDGGIFLEESDDNYIQNNEILDNGALGVTLTDSNSNNIIDNTISSFYSSIYFDFSNNNFIDNNIIKQYSESVGYGNGINLGDYSNYNTFIYNEISSSNNVFVIYNSENNTIFLNTLISDNSNVDYFSESSNIWESQTMYNYEYNETSYISHLGNYWSDYVFNDNDNDGIGDLPHNITITEKDHYPLIAFHENYAIGSEVESLILTGYCPIDLELIDPDGLKINKTVNEISGAVYLESDFNGDGELDDKIIIPNPKNGDYQIIVIPEPGATPTDTYSLEIVLGDTTITLADDQPIGDTPSQSYIINSDEGDIEPVVTVTSDININPDTLNSKSKGKWITCYIELDGTYSAADIDISTLMLNEEVSADEHPTSIGDHDNDGIDDLMIKFNRQEVINVLTPGDNVEITISGELTDDTEFQGTDYIKVI